MAQFIVRCPDRGFAAVKVRSGYFTINFSNGHIPRRYPAREFQLIMQELRNEGAKVECKSWSTPHVMIRPAVVDGASFYEASATMSFDNKEERPHVAHGDTPQEAYKAFWNLWNEQCDKLRLPRDVVVYNRTKVRL